MSNPQQPELRRSGKGETVEGSEELRASGSAGPGGAHAHGTDKGSKGGGEGGGVPPAQQPPYPS